MHKRFEAWRTNWPELTTRPHFVTYLATDDLLRAKTFTAYQNMRCLARRMHGTSIARGLLHAMYVKQREVFRRLEKRAPKGIIRAELMGAHRNVWRNCAEFLGSVVQFSDKDVQRGFVVIRDPVAVARSRYEPAACAHVGGEKQVATEADRTRQAELEIAEIVKTCESSPAQWEGELSDGRKFYLRYRWGCISAGFGSDMDEAVQDSMNRRDQVGDGLDGCMEQDEAVKHLLRFARAHDHVRAAVGRTVKPTPPEPAAEEEGGGEG